MQKRRGDAAPESTVLLINRSGSLLEVRLRRGAVPGPTSMQRPDRVPLPAKRATCFVRFSLQPRLCRSGLPAARLHTK